MVPGSASTRLYSKIARSLATPKLIAQGRMAARPRTFVLMTEDQAALLKIVGRWSHDRQPARRIFGRPRSGRKSFKFRGEGDDTQGQQAQGQQADQAPRFHSRSYAQARIYHKR